MRRLIPVVAALLLLFSYGVAAEDDGDIFTGDLQSLNVDDTARITATIDNPLPVEDSIELRLGGGAITNGLISLTVQTGPDVSCTAPNVCNVFVENKSRKNVNITVDATATGQDVLVGTVNSSTSNLENSDQLDVRVESHFGQESVTAPGITLLHILIIVLLGGATVFVVSSRRF